MAHDETLAAAIRELLPEATEKRMFGIDGWQLGAMLSHH